MALWSNRTRSSFSPTNQTQSTPVILLSTKISVLTVSTVMVGPPDFSTTRSPDLITVIDKIHGQRLGMSRGENRFDLSGHASPDKTQNKAARKCPGNCAPSSGRQISN